MCKLVKHRGKILPRTLENKEYKIEFAYAKKLIVEH